MPRSQGCCGALHYHAGLVGLAQQSAAANCDAFFSSPLAPRGTVGLSSPLAPRGRGVGGEGHFDAIITNAGGCGPVLKEYHHLLEQSPSADAGAQFAPKVRDIHEFLVELGPVQPEHPLPIKATYHDACGLCHGKRSARSRGQLLEMIPGLELVPLTESEMCCGAAGSYNITQPEMAEQVGLRKAEHILATEARAVFTGNVGCLLQIGKHLRRKRPYLWVAHPIDALWASYSGQMPGELARG